MKLRMLVPVVLFVAAMNIPRACAVDAEIACTMPLTNADNSELTDLAGFEILWGNVSGTYTERSGLIANTVPGSPGTGVITLTEGVWYIVAIATDDKGNESGFSEELEQAIVVKPGTVLNISITLL